MCVYLVLSPWRRQSDRFKLGMSSHRLDPKRKSRAGRDFDVRSTESIRGFSEVNGGFVDVDGRMGEWANGQMGKWAGKWANGQMGKWANGQMANGQMGK